MSTTVQNPKATSAISLKNGDAFSKNRGVTFGLQSFKFIQQEVHPQKQTNIETEISLPINLFHSSGEYNKMLIQRGYKEKISNIDRQMGVLKSLQYINDPLFEKEKEKRNDRVNHYERKMKKQGSVKAPSQIVKCNCCCCDDFCEDCATKSLCEREISHQESKFNAQESRRNWLIDIQGMKRGQYKKMKSQTKKIPLNQDFSSCHSRNIHSKYRIDELINNTLVKTIEDKRNKELIRLIKREHGDAVKNFNESVRLHNRCSSASKSKSKSKISVKPTKSEIRQAYWESIKVLIADELRKYKHKKGIVSEQKNQSHVGVCQHPKRHNLSQKQISKLILKREMEAKNQLIKQKVDKNELAKSKMKKLLALDAKQTQIIKKCRSHKFKPSQSIIEDAFTNIT